MHRFLIPLFLVALLVGCSPAPSADDSGKKPATGEITVDWKFEETRQDEYGQPFSDVSVLLSGDMNQVIVLGEFSGGCAKLSDEIMASGRSNVITGARCWWAGGGDDFIVRRSAPDELRVEHRTIDEGTAEAPAAEVPFSVMGDPIGIPAEVTVR